MLLALLALAAPALAAPDVPERAWRSTVQVDPLTFALGFAHIQFEGALSPRWSLYAGPHLRLFDGLLTEGHEPYVGYGAEVGVRGFFVGEAPEGGWVLARGVLAVATTATPTRQTAPAGYASLLVGYTGILGPGLVLSGGLGAQRIQYTVGDYGIAGFLPAAHTAVGWAF